MCAFLREKKRPEASLGMEGVETEPRDRVTRPRGKDLLEKHLALSTRLSNKPLPPAAQPPNLLPSASTMQGHGEKCFVANGAHIYGVRTRKSHRLW